MSLADTILTQIRAEARTRYAALDLPDEWIAPNYGGRSIVNVTATVARTFGVSMPTPPLDADIVGSLAAGAQRIIVIVVDALGYAKLSETLAANLQNGLHALLQRGGHLVPVTSVFPSTTTAALTALWSGYTAAEHGLLGYQLFLRDQGVRANMIYFNPVATVSQGRDQLIEGGLDPRNFLATPSLPQTLAPAGIPVYHLLAYPYVQSGLSRVQIRGAREVRGFVTSSDMWVVLRQMLEAQKDERAVFAVYWGGVDGIGHLYGPSSETLTAEINNLFYSFERDFLAPLSAAARRDTLLFLTADHGQMDTPVDHAIFMSDHPQLRAHLVMDLAGESRAAYLYCRPGHVDAARAYIQTELGDRFLVLDSPKALAAGLFGSRPYAPETEYRIGDLLVLPRRDFTLVDTPDDHLLLGRHGGLTEAEMLVPLVTARLDGE